MLRAPRLNPLRGAAYHNPDWGSTTPVHQYPPETLASFIARAQQRAPINQIKVLGVVDVDGDYPGHIACGSRALGVLSAFEGSYIDDEDDLVYVYGKYTLWVQPEQESEARKILGI